MIGERDQASEGCGEGVGVQPWDKDFGGTDRQPQSGKKKKKREQAGSRPPAAAEKEIQVWWATASNAKITPHHTWKKISVSLLHLREGFIDIFYINFYLNKEVIRKLVINYLFLRLLSISEY